MILTKKIQEKFFNQNAKIKELEDKLNKKNNGINVPKNIVKDLEKASIKKIVKLRDEYENKIKEIKDDLKKNDQNILSEEIKKAYLESKNMSSNNKARTFAPPDNTDMPPLETEEEAAENIADIYERRHTSEEEIDLNDIDNLINRINRNHITNIPVIIGDKEKVYFDGAIDFLKDMKDGKINNSNKKKLIKIGLVRLKITS